MSRALCVIAESTTVAVRLAPGRGGRRLFLSYAGQVPAAGEFDSLTFWMADAYAARLQLAGLAPALAAPPWDWLSGLDPDLLGRRVVSTTLDRVPPGRVFLKPALLKLVGAPAGVWDVADFRRAALADGADERLRVQHCRDLLDLDHEHRFVVCEGQVLTGSPYRVAGRAWSPSLSSDRSPEAAAFARHVVRELGPDRPPVCSLDVAWDRGNRRWLVVEANPLWASGPYACDPVAFVDAVEHANVVGVERWAWRAEETQLARARAQEPVVAVGQDEATGYAEFAA
ncbi:ATP-grasp domain-containing protein [Kineococcus sp. TBRC 1896]|uniref:ATP-grasp domain-containing protein n=1 Tax=Kineococcus mangrovi TaxID=1660183 RepID=A0ABV4I3M1_9ACTN